MIAATIGTYVVLGPWVLTSRWLHEKMHNIEGIDLGRLFHVESAFDVALIVGATAIAWTFVAASRDMRHP